jgi:hypothetical protein
VPTVAGTSLALVMTTVVLRTPAASPSASFGTSSPARTTRVATAPGRSVVGDA